MKAEVSKQGDITIVNLKGHLDFETAEPFRRTFLSKLRNEKVIFNFQELSFVGSSGITLFFDLLNEFAARVEVKPKFCGMGSEFKKIFAASALAELQIYDSPVSAVTSFTMPVPTVNLQPVPDVDEPWLDDELPK
ncbi:MAG TPA: STAS domain-containing protein [Bdellovibrionales bacterium]|nr:STAS domain-containing protein [Bdellovibrionales bacterium]